jgi:uncharacterized membrane protein (DUF2068 family)
MSKDALPRRDAGLRVITAYKLVKGCISLAGALALAVTILTHHAHAIDSWATALAHHMTRAWSLELAHLLQGIVQPKRLWLATGALAVDGALTTIEGWALHHGKRWGEWLVVVASGSLLPFEIIAIARGVHVWRVAAFLLNAVIVWYLARRAWRRHRAHGAALSAPATRSTPADPAGPSPPLGVPPPR